jgi:hypothetical protein
MLYAVTFIVLDLKLISHTFTARNKCLKEEIFLTEIFFSLNFHASLFLNVYFYHKSL